MRILMAFLTLGITINLYSQDFKSILNESEADSINTGFTISKVIDRTNCKDFDDFQGKMMISKSNSKYDWYFVGLSSKYDSNNQLKAQFHFDSIGYMTTYQEFNNKGGIVYDCIYDYKIIKNCKYRLEHIKLYYVVNSLREEGWRYLKIIDKNGKKCEFSSQRKYGKWIYYWDDGTVEKTKDYGEIK